MRGNFSVFRIKLKFSESTSMIKMKRLEFYFVSVLSCSTIFACQTNIPLEVWNGCAFESLALVSPSSGFVITENFCGLEVHKEVFSEQPYVFYSDASDFVKYTLIMVDNDNPFVDDENMYLHWLATDIDGQSLKYGLGIYAGNTVAGNKAFELFNFISNSQT
jgi:hypothetical protein